MDSKIALSAPIIIIGSTILAGVLTGSIDPNQLIPNLTIIGEALNKPTTLVQVIAIVVALGFVFSAKSKS